MGAPLAGAELALGVIEAANATVGTAMTVGGAAAEGDEGFVVADASIVYPKELPQNLWVGDHSPLNNDVIKFVMDGWTWNNYCNVAMAGYCSNSTEDPMCYVEGEDPTLPANRWISVRFGVSGSSEDLGEGLITCSIHPHEDVTAGDSPDQPMIPVYVEGRCDPVGPGDSRYSFWMYVDTFGGVWLDGSTVQSRQCTVTQQGDHIQVYMNQ